MTLVFLLSYASTADHERLQRAQDYWPRRVWGSVRLQESGHRENVSLCLLTRAMRVHYGGLASTERDRCLNLGHQPGPLLLRAAVKLTGATYGVPTPVSPSCNRYLFLLELELGPHDALATEAP